jgi:hypothetical protein
MVATEPYTSYPTNLSAAADWTSKQQCCLTVGVIYFCQFRCNIFVNRAKVSKPCIVFNLYIVQMNSITGIYFITYIYIYIFHVFPSLPEASAPPVMLSCLDQYGVA